MRSSRRNITALVLVLLLATPMIFSITLAVQQKLINISSQLTLSEKTIQTVSVSKSKISWVKKGKEVIIDGKYFDVRSFETSGDQLLLTGHYDHNEDKIVERLKKIFQKPNHSESPVSQFVIIFAFFPAFSNITELTYSPAWHAVSTNYFSFIELLPTAPILSFIQPPEI